MVTTIQEVRILEAFIYGTEDKSVEAFPRANRLQGEDPFIGFDNWQDAINPVADYSHLVNQDFIDWETERLAKEANDQTSKQNVRTILANYSNVTMQDYELVVSIEQQCAGVFMNGQDPTIETMHSTLVSLLNGSALETPAVSYVKRVANVPSIGTDLPREFNVAMQFLRIIKGAYETVNRP